MVVSGLPGAGKTTLAGRLGDALCLPVVHRDVVKESFARLAGGPDIGATSFVAFYAIVAAHLEAGVGVVAEAAFHRQWSRLELAGIAALGSTVVVHCDLPAELARHRFAERMASGARHPCHPDDRYLAQARADPGHADAYGPPELAVPMVSVDTTDGYRPGLDEIVSFVERSSRVDA